jgi:hypothetical protein
MLSILKYTLKGALIGAVSFSSVVLIPTLIILIMNLINRDFSNWSQPSSDPRVKPGVTNLDIALTQNLILLVGGTCVGATCGASYGIANSIYSFFSKKTQNSNDRQDVRNINTIDTPSVNKQQKLA